MSPVGAVATLGAGVHPDRIREALAPWDFDTPIPAEEVLAWCAERLPWGALPSHDPRHLGLLDPGVDPVAAAAGADTLQHDPQLALWASAPFAVELEQHVLRALAARLGYTPPDLHATFTAGGAESNFTATVLALGHKQPDYREAGLWAFPGRPVVYASPEAHATVHRAALLAGLGREGVHTVPCDRHYRIDPKALRRAIGADRDAGRVPTLLVATAGATSTGTIDPLTPLADLAAAEGLWLHVDAAWGALLALSPRLRGALDGIARADSVTWCAHKTLGAPVGTGMFFAREAAHARAVLGFEAPYMPPAPRKNDRVTPYRETVQWSRRCVGAAVFALLATRGWHPLAASLESRCALAAHLRTRLLTHGWTLLGETPLPLVCFTHPRLLQGRPTPRALALQLRRADVAWVSPTRAAGRVPALRASIVRDDTTQHHLDDLVGALVEAVR